MISLILKQIHLIQKIYPNLPDGRQVPVQTIENNFAPWKFSPDDRDKWVVEMV